eukprot:CAMPEP_0206601508 /NCGR_PEP_ID=MMETSP0325_2-20121206/46674_1 /ASSEMBLY_ACC=CAM_ASM_000347 /TAXON_ID=2866 /ORGANISM="Crypthecodinium cohnii, Strain Seligo" /LENGTH=51 /DNA_ID=CAMNT_0054113499 /DNA_START=143 /DNA_END=294 /DNA_ORIENTATION=-
MPPHQQQKMRPGPRHCLSSIGPRTLAGPSEVAQMPEQGPLTVGSAVKLMIV